MLLDSKVGRGLWEAATGVERLPGLSLVPVVIAVNPVELDPSIALALPLLARRRQVFVAEGHVPPGELPDRFALVVAPGCEAHIAADPRISAMIAMRPPGVTFAPDYPALVIGPNDRTLYPETADLRFAEACHPAELAHLIDSFLREPLRYQPHSMITRARP